MAVGLDATKDDTSGSSTSTVSPGQVGTRVGTERRWLSPAICIGLYVALAMMEFGHFGSLGPGHMAGLATMDSIEQIWWLAWTAFAVPHWHGVFLAQGQNYPFGENFGVNGSMLALGVIFLPITKVFGPVVTFNIALRLAPAASASSMCLVLRRWTRWWPAAFFGGLLYGFSASMDAHLNYLFLTFAPLPPLIFLLVHEVVVRQSWRPGRTGVLLGILLALQFFVSTEILASTVVVAGVAIVLFAVANRHVISKQWKYACLALAWTTGVCFLVLAVPILVTFAGAQHLNGPPMSATALAHVPSDLRSSIFPQSQWLAPKQLSGSGIGLVYGGQLYLGIPMIVVLALFAILLRRRRALLYSAAMACICFVLSLGTEVADGTRTPLPLPFEILTHIPVLNGMIASRFSLFTALFAAATFAIGIDELHLRVIGMRRRRIIIPLTNPTIAAVVVALIAATVLIPLVPRHTDATSPTNVPTFFTTSAVNVLPPGGAVLAYPYPDLASDYWLAAILPTHSILLDQAVGGMRFKVLGGYGWFPSPTGPVATSSPALLGPRSVQTLFDVAFAGGHRTRSQSEVLSGSDTTGDLRAFLRRWRVQSVLVIHLDDWAPLRSRITAAIGPPIESGGVTIWPHVGQRLESMG